MWIKNMELALMYFFKEIILLEKYVNLNFKSIHNITKEYKDKLNNLDIYDESFLLEFYK